MKLYRKRKIETSIDLTPMLDTLLQVHIAFMFLMSFAASSVKIDLPRGTASDEKTALPVVVAVDAQNQMYLNDERIRVEDLAVRLPPLFDKLGKREAILRADQALPYKHVLAAFRAMAQAGAVQIHLAYDEERAP